MYFLMLMNNKIKPFPYTVCMFLFYPGWSFSMGSAYQFHSWRVFVIMCALPCVSAVVALTFMPESPRFLLEVKFLYHSTSY